MSQTTPSEDHSSTPDGEKLPESQVNLDILAREFDRDFSPLVHDQAPSRINFSPDNYTTVERKVGNTLYNSEGKVETTIPPLYFENIKKYGFEVPTVVNDTTGEYLLMPSSLNNCPKISYNLSNLIGIVGKLVGFPNHTNQIPGNITIEIEQFFENKNSGISMVPDWGEGYRRVDPSKFTAAWFRLIQGGKIRFADEEKVKHFTIGETPLVEPSDAIKAELGKASWTAKFPNKKTLFVSEGKLKIFDWKDEVAANWSITEIELPPEIQNPTGGGLDPKENFILVGSDHDLYVVDPYAKPPKIMQKFNNPDTEFHGVIHLKDDGTIIAGDKYGRITSIASNLHDFPNRRERLEQERVIQRLKNKKRTKGAKGGADKKGPLTPEMAEISNEVHEQFIGDIMAADSLEQINKIRKEVVAMKAEYASELKNTKIVEEMFGPIMEALKEKETSLLAAKIDSEMQSVRGLLGRIEGMSLVDLADARRRVDTLKGTVMASNLDSAIKAEIGTISDTFAERAAEAIGSDEDKLIAQMDGHVQKVKEKLEGITKLSEFEVWKNTDYPAFQDALDVQMRIIPASHQKVIEKIRQLIETARKLKDEYTKKFAEQYEDVRKKASNQTHILEKLTADRIDEFLENFKFEVQKKHFRTPEEAREWVERNPVYSAALALIDDLNSKDPEKADMQRQRLKVEVAQLAYEVKQMKDSTVDSETGRQMVHFGKISFPVWEEDGAEKAKRVTIDLTYRVEDSSKGAGIKPDDYMCELFYKITDENGKVEEIPMHEEDVEKYGRYDERFHDDSYFESHIPQLRAKKMLSSIKSMESAKAQGVKIKHEEFQEKIERLNGKIAELKSAAKGGAAEAVTNSWSALKDERDSLTKEYITFLQESGIYGWYALKAFRKHHKIEDKEESSSGQGRVPEKAPYWVRDEATEKYLEQFAEMAKLSLKNREGIISLEGHAGTGKDVLVQMFAEQTKRPLYSFDCSKWTTEFDLSQDVSLSAEGGASFTVKDDSVIVKALERPGSILYFNEFNAMPEQAQIFLHSLFDAKRQITLKTSSGRIVKADPTVIICSSMNPGYPGTNHPQQGTRSRMIPIKLDFPEFKKQDGHYSAAEALRIARSVKSLEDLAVNPDMEENEFVKLWDGYINKGISNGGMTPERKFDLEVIFALITFAWQIRKAFIAKISNAGGKKTFTISQPFTLREMRRCAYIISNMDASEKQNPDNAEKVAKDLIRKFYSPYIFNEKESAELETQLSQWTAQKPMRGSP